jgi:hypothetical protein
VSPDGRFLGWARNVPSIGVGNGWVDGHAVMDTVTGEVRELEDPASVSGLLRPAPLGAAVLR